MSALDRSGDIQDRFINRELSWLRFNERVLAEAKDLKNPLFERLKFLAIFESNLDEFYMVRVSGLIEQYEGGILELSPDGLSPSEQLSMISRSVVPLRREAGKVWSDSLTPELADNGIHIREYSSLSGKKREDLDRYFRSHVFPLCTPLILHPAATLPFISNRSLNLAVNIGPSSDRRLARIKIPVGGAPRLVPIPGKHYEFVLLGDLMRHNLDQFFPGVPIHKAHEFRVIRDADLEIRQLEAADLISSIEESLKLRRFGDPVLLECSEEMPDATVNLLAQLLNLEEDDIVRVPGLIGFDALWEIVKIDKPALRFPPFSPYLPENLSKASSIFETVSNGDVLLHHPYDSFWPVEEFVASAKSDPSVFGIKQTLYRVGSASPIIEHLRDAAAEGKQVAALVELKARFDEENNLIWARTLEQAGAHVTYGFPEMKTHCKLCLIVRREGDKTKSYVHVGTGNYNQVTARQYTDLGLLTCDPEIAKDVSELFNYLTGFSRQSAYRRILVAPSNLREGILERIQRERSICRASGRGRIVWKLNALVDPEVIDELYRASQEGVDIDLIIRGICCLRPGVPNLSENIRVRSIIGRFLEHSRVYYFGNAGDPDVLIGSADAMRRNLDRRIEVLCPVLDPKLRRYLKVNLLDVMLKDNVRAWKLGSDGSYAKPSIRPSAAHLDSQLVFLLHPTCQHLIGAPKERTGRLKLRQRKPSKQRKSNH